jgi:hypothetical protein
MTRTTNTDIKVGIVIGTKAGTDTGREIIGSTEVEAMREVGMVDLTEVVVVLDRIPPDARIGLNHLTGAGHIVGMIETQDTVRE